ncbi:MAG: hypothetical protein FWC04_07530 [Chitinispirillia bacterium]|nr:hypothetical protein [Chitinispirillia bacterium]
MIIANQHKSSVVRISAALLALTALIPPFHARAGADSLFSMPVSAAHLGRGTVSSSGSMDASDVYRYTANTALAGGGQFAFGLSGRPDGDGAWYGAAALPLFYTGAAGIFVKSGTAASGALGFSLANYYEDYRFGIGGHLALLKSGISRSGTNYFWAPGVDLRVDPYDAFSARAYYTSAGLPLTARNSPILSRLPDQYGVIANFRPLSGAQTFWGADMGIGAQKTGYDPLLLGVSAEIGLGRTLFARAGYETPVNAPAGLGGISAGAGLLIRNAGANFGYRFGETLEGGGTWAFDAKIQIEAIKKRNVDDNLALAWDRYGQNRLKMASLYSSRVLAGDSAHWNAQALRAKAEAGYRRDKGRDVAIIYGGNSRGVVIPYPPDPDALGGISRHAAVVAELRKAWPRHFAIDVGNMMSEHNHELKVELVASYYDMVNFDAIAPGEGELAMGPWKFMEAQKRELPIVITNLHDNDQNKTGIWSSLLMSSHGYSVYMLNLLCGSVLSDSATFDFGLNIPAMRQLLATDRGANADMRIAVVHGSLDEIRKVAAVLPEIDVIIAGSLEERFDTPLLLGNTYVLSAGSENRFAGCFTMRTGRAGLRENAARGGPRVTVTNKLYPIYQSISPDPGVEEITKLVSVAVPPPDTSLRGLRVTGVIPHLAQRTGGRTDAFIKIAEAMKEHPLGPGLPNLRRPAFSPANNRAAVIYGNQNAGALGLIDLHTMSGITAAKGRNVTEAAFSPADGFLYYIEADSGKTAGAIYKTKRYMYEAITVIPSDSAERRDLHISEDGASILYCAKDENGRWHIYASDSSAAAPPVQLTHGNAGHRLPRLSRNGKRAAYLSDRTSFGGQMDLWTFQRDGTPHKQLTFNANVRDFTWADDDQTIYFSSGANMTEICGISVDGTAAEKLVEPPKNAPKSWSEHTPRFIRYKNEPMIVYTRESADGSKRIHWYNINSKKDEKLHKFEGTNEWLGEGW